MGQEDEDEDEEAIYEDEPPPLASSDEEHDEEPSPYAHLGEDRPRLCQQQVPLEVNGNFVFLHTLYDWETPNTLVRIEAARRIDLQSVRIPRQAIKGYQGVGTITDSVYYLPLMDADGNIQVIRAYGVEEITVVARTRLPPLAREIFPESPCRGWRRERGTWSCSYGWTTSSGCPSTWRTRGTQTTT